MYNDSSGEFAFLVPVFAWIALKAAIIGTAALIGAGIGATIYGIQAYITGNWSWGGFAKAVFGGALTGAVSGALGQVFSASGFWATVGNGALAGAGGGGINALLNGQSFLEGLTKGAMIGGAMGAVSYGLGKLFQGNSKNSVNYEMEANPENIINGDTPPGNAKDAWNNNWKDAYKSTNNMKDAYLMKEGTVPNGYSIDSKTGLFINKSDGSKSWAVTNTTYSDKAKTLVDKHKLYISKAALKSKEQLNYVLNHEFGHMVLNNNYGDTINKIIGEGLIDTQAHRAIQLTGSKFLQLNGWSNLKLGGVYKGYLGGGLQPEYSLMKHLEKLIIKIK